MMLKQGNILTTYRTFRGMENTKHSNKESDEIIQREPLAMAQYLILEDNARPYRRIKMPMHKNPTLYPQITPREIAPSLIVIAPPFHIGRTSESIAKT